MNCPHCNAPPRLDINGIEVYECGTKYWDDKSNLSDKCRLKVCEALLAECHYTLSTVLGYLMVPTSNLDAENLVKALLARLDSRALELDPPRTA